MMNNKKSERELLLEHFDANTPVLVVHGTGTIPDWSCVARLGDLMEALIPQRGNDYECTDAKIGLVVVAPVGLNLSGRVIDIVTLVPGSASLAALGLAAFASVRVGVATDATDAADARRHADVISQLAFRREG